MRTGVYLEKGPADWQILQQNDGEALVTMEGCYYIEEIHKTMEGNSVEDAAVFVRVLEENTGRIVKNFILCHMLAGDRWQVAFSLPAGGLYRIETSLSLDPNRSAMEWNSRGDMVHHVGVGDVYVIAGQSNSAGYGKDSVYDPPEMGIHLLKNSGKWDIACHPMNDTTGSIHAANFEGANSGHSPYLAFARRLKQVLNYPIGLIQTALGGTSLAQWSPDVPDGLYANMIETVRTQGDVKGILWYQGCSDALSEDYKDYEETFAKMVEKTREDLRNPALPWLTIQLNRLTNSEQEVDVLWGTVREHQRQAAHHLPGVSVIPATDVGMSDGIHNRCSGNVMLGERLAEMALYDIYGKKDRMAMAPDLQEATYDAVKNQMQLTLSRPLKGRAFVHGEWQTNPANPPVMDTASHLPILSFYGVEIGRE